MAQCFFTLSLYEDALIFSKKALDLDPNHVKSLSLKAKSLALLFHFKESIKILNDIED